MDHKPLASEDGEYHGVGSMHNLFSYNDVSVTVTCNSVSKKLHVYNTFAMLYYIDVAVFVCIQDCYGQKLIYFYVLLQSIIQKSR